MKKTALITAYLFILLSFWILGYVITCDAIWMVHSNTGKATSILFAFMVTLAFYEELKEIK